MFEQQQQQQRGWLSHLVIDVVVEGLPVALVQVLRVVVWRLLGAHVVDRPAKQPGCEPRAIPGCGKRRGSAALLHLRVEHHVLLCVELRLRLALQQSNELVDATLQRSRASGRQQQTAEVCDGSPRAWANPHLHGSPSLL